MDREDAPSPLDEPLNKLDKVVRGWNEKTRKTQAANAGFQTAMTSYSAILNQINTQFQSQLKALESQVEPSGNASYGAELEKLKEEFTAALQREKQSHANTVRAMEAQMLRVQSEAARALETATGEERRRRNDVETRLANVERREREAVRAAEEAKDAAVEAKAAYEDAKAAVARLTSMEKSLRVANDRLKEKLAEEQKSREAEALARDATLQKWRAELDAAKHAERAAKEWEEKAKAAERRNAELDKEVKEAKTAKEEFLFSVQMANERLKEKLRVAEGGRADLAAKNREIEKLEREVLELEGRKADLEQQLRLREVDAQQARRYKEDWMQEVKKRVLVEERAQQTAQQLKDLQTVSEELQKAQLKSRDLEGKSGRLEAECEALRQAAREAERKVGQYVGRVEELESERERLTRKVAEKEQELAAEKQQVAKIQEREALATRLVREKEQSVDKIAAELKEVQQKLSAADAQILAEVRRAASFSAVNAQLEKELERFKASHDETLQSRVQDLLNSSGAMAMELDHAAARGDSLAKELAEAQSAVIALRSEVELHRREAAEATETAKSWKARYEEATEHAKKEEEVTQTLAAQKQRLEMREVEWEKRDREYSLRSTNLANRIRALEVQLEEANGIQQALQDKVSHAAHVTTFVERIVSAVRSSLEGSTSARHELRAQDCPVELSALWDAVQRLFEILDVNSDQLRTAVSRAQHAEVKAEEEARAREFAEQRLRESLGTPVQALARVEPAGPLVAVQPAGAIVAVQPAGPLVAAHVVSSEEGSSAPSFVVEAPVVAPPSPPRAQEGSKGLPLPFPQNDFSTPEGVMESVRGAVEEKIGRPLGAFQIREKRDQKHPVGKTWFFKVEIGDGSLFWVRVFHTLGSAPTLHSVQGPKPPGPLIYFDKTEIATVANEQQHEDEDDEDEDEDDDGDDDEQEEGDEEDVQPQTKRGREEVDEDENNDEGDDDDGNVVDVDDDDGKESVQDERFVRKVVVELDENEGAGSPRVESVEESVSHSVSVAPSVEANEQEEHEEEERGDDDGGEESRRESEVSASASASAARDEGESKPKRARRGAASAVRKPKAKTTAVAHSPVVHSAYGLRSKDRSSGRESRAKTTSAAKESRSKKSSGTESRTKTKRRK